MTNIITCPYCRETVEKPSPDRFQPCTSCGYKSARVGSETDGYLVIDSQLPDLISKYGELQQGESKPVILIDRRIGHNAIAGEDRRR